LIFYQIYGFLAITFEPETLERQSIAQKTQIIAQFPIKLESKIDSFGWGPGPDDLGQKGLNLPHYPTYDVTHKRPETQNLQIKKKSKLEDSSHLLRV